MRKRRLASSVCVIALSIAAAASAQPSDGDNNAQVIVKYRPDSRLLRKNLSAAQQVEQQVTALGARVGLKLAAGAAIADRTHAVTATGITAQQLAQRLSTEPDIEYAVPDERRHVMAIPNDPLFFTGPAISGVSGGPVAGQWYLRIPDGEVQSSINVEAAWDLTAGGTPVVVAVLDTGVRHEHPDLLSVTSGGVILPGYDMITNASTSNDGDGRDADASDPGDWVSQADVSQPGGRFATCTIENSSWHGTQTSGLIGALTNNGVGMAGVARNVRVVPVRVLGKCGGTDSDIMAGMRWAAGLSVPGIPDNPNPARVLNMSLGGSGNCNAAYIDTVAQINAVGGVVVVAAGNGSGHAVGSPANCPGVIAVAGLRHIGTKVGFSSIGPQVAISAPGGNCVNIGAGEACLYPILTTSNAGVTNPVVDVDAGSTYTSSFRTSLGTSFSAPLVTGTVALILSLRPDLHYDEVLGVLQSSARPFPSSGSSTTQDVCTAPNAIDQLECYCTTSTCGAGMLDAGNALMALVAGAPTPATVTVAEFYHPQFDHYFITADAAEASSLASGGLPPWRASGLTFKVWNGPGVNVTRVCRFFSTSFGALSSHFYSNNPFECPELQNGGVWQLERSDAFYMMPSAAGTCPAGTVALYRLYNMGKGGAPNHRYTTDLGVRAVMIGSGWGSEGSGNDGVFACVPAA